MTPPAAPRALLVGFDLDLTLVDSRARIGTCLAAALAAAGAPVTVLPGAVAALGAVRAAGGRTAVVGTKTGPAVREVLTETGLGDLVDVAVGDRFGARARCSSRSARARTSATTRVMSWRRAPLAWTAWRC